MHCIITTGIWFSRWVVSSKFGVLVVACGLIFQGAANALEPALMSQQEVLREALKVEPFNTDVEPVITPEQSTILQPVLELMRDDTKAATEELEWILKNPDIVISETEGIGADETLSAVFDFTLANLYFQDEKYEQALSWYARAIQKFPQFRRAYKNTALIHAQQGNLPKVIEPLTRSIEMGESNSSLYGLLAACLLREERFIAAESAYRQALLLEPQKLDFKLGLSRSIFEQGRYEEAVALSRELIREFPERPDFWILQSNAYLAMGRTRKAAENYEILYRMDKADPRTLNLLGDIYVNNGQFPLAANSYIRAFESDEAKAVKAPLRGAKVLLARNALNEAKLILENVKMASGDQMAKEDLRDLLKTESRIAIAQGAGMEVIKVLNEIIEEDPDDGESMMALGRQYTQMSEFGKARDLYESAAKLEDFKVDATIKMGTMLVRQSQFMELSQAVPVLEESISLLEDALKMQPQDRLIDYLEKIKTLHASKQRKLEVIRTKELEEREAAELKKQNQDPVQENTLALN
ncbi:MAG: tetratricopeptide repeat protein [Verrucomicrobiota bacterium]